MAVVSYFLIQFDFCLSVVAVFFRMIYVYIYAAAGVPCSGDRAGVEHAPLRVPRGIRSVRRPPLPGLPVRSGLVSVIDDRDRQDRQPDRQLGLYSTSKYIRRAAWLLVM